MSDVLVVRLHGWDVCEIVRLPGGRIEMEFYPAYAAQRDRPTLSLSFLDDDGEVRGGGQHTDNGELPDFFSNLLPEGELRSYLAAKAGALTGNADLHAKNWSIRRSQASIRVFLGVVRRQFVFPHGPGGRIDPMLEMLVREFKRTSSASPQAHQTRWHRC